MTDAVARLNAALADRYRIERTLGEGGMATVYLARDVKHNRHVALKVLKPELTAAVGAERFLAEIETTAKLQHPRILPLFDSGEVDGLLFYVMPYVEGETLADRLARERQLSVSDAVQIAQNVAEGLDYAHRHGVVHRDIKPANILLQDGKPVIADFGIALAVGAAGAGRLTETGLSLGTPHYMSPEQATGDQHTGAPTDVYALGCVLYEMLVGEPPHTGSTAQAILGKIILAEPDAVTSHRKAVPPHVDAVVRRALEKVPADRFAGAADLATALDDPGFRHGEVTGVSPVESAWPWKRLALGMTVVACIAAGVAVWPGGPPRPAGGDAAPNRVMRFALPLGEEGNLYLGDTLSTTYGRPAVTSLALSPQGDLLVYTAWQQSEDGTLRSRLYQRRLDQERITPIDGAETSGIPFFSPDGKWIGFFSEAGLQRASVPEGIVETIVANPGFPIGGATWGDDDTIVWWTAEENLYRVSATGGPRTLLAARDTALAGFNFRQPHMLPGSRVLLFTGAPGAPFFVDVAQASVFALDVATGERQLVVANATDPRYVRTGHLLFMREGTLMAVRFDPDRLVVSGDPVIVVDDVMHAIGMPASVYNSGNAQVAISDSGDLVYARGSVFPPRPMRLVRVSPEGAAQPLDAEPNLYQWVRISPQGDRLALSQRGASNSYRLSVRDLARRVTEPLRSGGGVSGALPEWSPDGGSLAFTLTGEEGAPNVSRMSVSEAGVPERLAPSTELQSMMSWSSLGVIAFVQANDIWMLPPNGQPAPFFTSDAIESYATFSPDGRWLAYVSNQTGRPEVYVRPYPGPGPATLISSAGGSDPVWSRNGRQLFFLQPIERRVVMMAADVFGEADFRASAAVPLIDPWPYSTAFPGRSHDVFADGSFVALLKEATVSGIGTLTSTRPAREAEKVNEVHIILNWFEELRARVPN